MPLISIGTLLADALVAILVAIAAVLILTALLYDPVFRFAFVVFGGLLTLQTSQQLTVAKWGYLVGSLVALAIAAAQLPRRAKTTGYRLIRPLFLSSALVAAVLVVSLPVALAHHTALSNWIRDTAPYYLFASIPVFAVDVSSSRFARWLPRLFLIAGFLAAMSLSLEWLDRRRLVGQVLVSRLVLPSFFLPAALLSFGVSRSISVAKARVWWLLACAFLTALLLITGNRSNLLLLVAVVVVLWLRSSSLRFGVRPILVGVLTVVLLAAFVGGVAFLTRASPTGIIERFTSIETLIAHPQSDKSFDVRIEESRQAWDVFLSNPILGAGPGHIFTWTDDQGKRMAGFNIDTGLAIPAKFGIVGSAALAFALLQLIWFGWRFRSQVPLLGGDALAALAGCATVAVCWLIVGSPFEDKGLSFGLLYLLALGAAAVGIETPEDVSRTSIGLASGAPSYP